MSRQDGGENYIEIPGVGRIPMPPGAKVFQPRGGAQRFGGDDDEPAPVAPKPAPPPAPKSPEQARAAALEDLLARLKNAADESEAVGHWRQNPRPFRQRPFRDRRFAD